MRFHIITIFPDIFDSYLNESIIGRAIKNKIISVKFYNPRDFARPAKLQRSRVKADGWFYKQVDDRPYGGGPGMVMQAPPILRAVTSAMRGKNKKYKIIIFAPGGKKFTNVLAKNYSYKYTDIIMISGRYEGVDARVKKILKAEEVSIGDYILTGGELPAMVLIDSISRQIPGVLGKYESLEEKRVSGSEFYTRPEVLKYTPPGRGKKSKNYKVPKILLSGHQAKIEEWKKNRIR